jgi:hypothetical protein
MFFAFAQAMEQALVAPVFPLGLSYALLADGRMIGNRKEHNNPLSPSVDRAHILLQTQQRVIRTVFWAASDLDQFLQHG